MIKPVTSLSTALAAVFLLTAAASGNALDDIEKDKYMHFAAGVVISHVSYPVFLAMTDDKTSALWYSIGLTVLAGVGKELYDQRTTEFDGGDLAASVLGGLTIIVVKF
jgi:hypothetical protein